MHLRSLSFLAVAVVALSGCGKSDSNQASPSEAKPPAAAQPTAATAAKHPAVTNPLGFDFDLSKQPPLEQTKALEEVPEEQQKAIYLEMSQVMKETSQRVFAANLPTDQAVTAMDNAQNMAKYELAKMHGLTVAQLDQLDVLGQRFGWGKESQ